MDEFEKKFGNYLKLLDIIEIKVALDNLKWFKEKGKVLFITQNNILEFIGYWKK